MYMIEGKNFRASFEANGMGRGCVLHWIRNAIVLGITFKRPLCQVNQIVKFRVRGSYEEARDSELRTTAVGGAAVKLKTSNAPLSGSCGSLAHLNECAGRLVSSISSEIYPRHVKAQGPTFDRVLDA